jgi:hypothetical protein
VFIQFAEPPVEEIQMQHYAFLVDDERLDAILARVRRTGFRTRPTRTLRVRTADAASTSTTRPGTGSRY